MSAWPGKYVIGLTGNIATGKSVVRKMLEHLGAYGIDADALSHRAIAKGAPGFEPVVETFGRWIVDAEGHVDRTKLARVVFADPDALVRLEAIVHPLVREAVDVLVRRAPQPVIVIEAIKLLEGELRQATDNIWVTYSPYDQQLARLVRKRGMSEENARQRIQAQPPQELKLAAANTVIRNEGSFEDTWRQVVAAWQAIFPSPEAEPVRQVQVAEGELVVEKARPRQAEEIAEFITRMDLERSPVTRADIMAAFGEKAFMLLLRNELIVGLVGWQVENLVARTADVYLEPDIPADEALRVLMEEVERASRELQCEASLLFLSPQLARQESVWRKLHYEQREPQTLGVRAWQEAAVESRPNGEVLLFKQLRVDRVLRPV